jgi:hypothetical protein
MWVQVAASAAYISESAPRGRGRTLSSWRVELLGQRRGIERDASPSVKWERDTLGHRCVDSTGDWST